VRRATINEWETTMKTSNGREQIGAGLIVYPVRRKDGRIVWVTVPKK
jgi:hypothetical protein